MSTKTTPENTPIPSCCDQRSQSFKLEKNKKDDNQIEELAK